MTISNEPSKRIEKLIQDLRQTEASTNLFNPYRDICPMHDLPNAPRVRQNNLRLLLNTHLHLNTKTFWLFEAPSHLRARRSGAPFVNEGMFSEIKQILGANGSFEKATTTKAETAMTSKIAWRVAKELGLRPLIWEALPFHPHESDRAISNRRPTKKELIKYQNFLHEVLDIFKPEEIIAVGRVAEKSLSTLGIEARYVRHPAQGGAREFEEEISISSP